jgi:hypothetical protein
MRLLAGVVCLFCALTAVAARAETLDDNFTAIDSRRLSAEFTPAPYGTRVSDESARKWKRHWAVSTVALVAASVLDASSSWGKNEANPVLQSGRHTFGGRSAAIKLGITAVPILLQHLAARNNDELYKSFTIANYGAASFFTGVAIRNYGIPSTPAR